jgi:hypothetical protein
MIILRNGNMKKFHANNLTFQPTITSKLLTLMNSGLSLKLFIEKLIEDILDSPKYDEILELLETKK